MSDPGHADAVAAQLRAAERAGDLPDEIDAEGVATDGGTEVPWTTAAEHLDQHVDAVDLPLEDQHVERARELVDEFHEANPSFSMSPRLLAAAALDIACREQFVDGVSHRKIALAFDSNSASLNQRYRKLLTVVETDLTDDGQLVADGGRDNPAARYWDRYVGQASAAGWLSAAGGWIAVGTVAALLVGWFVLGLLGLAILLSRGGPL